jgi:hypothetical protein
MAAKRIDEAKLRELVEAGERPSEVARQLGVARSTVEKWITRLKLAGRSFQKCASCGGPRGHRKGKGTKCPTCFRAEKQIFRIPKRHDNPSVDHDGHEDRLAEFECRLSLGLPLFGGIDADQARALALALAERKARSEGDGVMVG